MVGADYVLGVAVSQRGCNCGFLWVFLIKAAGGVLNGILPPHPPPGAACNGEQTQQNTEHLGKGLDKGYKTCSSV